MTSSSDPAAEAVASRFGPAAIVIAVSVWLTRSFWMPGGFVVGFDTYAYSGPNLEVTRAAIREWRLPLVNDLIFAGTVHLGNPQVGVLYPAHLVALVFETNRAMGIIVTLHVVLLGIGMLVLARRLSYGPIGSTVSAIVAVAAGASLTKTVQFEQIQVLAWAPMLVATIHASLTSTRRWTSAAALAATTAAVLLSGHPQLVYETILLAVAATIGFTIGGERWRRLPVVALGVGLGASIALPQLVASLLATADSAISGGRTLAELEAPGLTLHPAHTARAILGTVQDRDPAAFAGGFESIGFIGVVVAIVAVIGAVHLIGRRWSRPWAIAFAVLGAVSLLWTFGPRTVVFRIAFEVLPGFDLARGSARWMVIVVLVAALFAGAGADAIAGGLRRHDVVVAAGAVVAVALAIAVGPLVTADSRSAAIWAVTALLVVGLIAVGTMAGGERRHVVLMATTVALLVLGSIEMMLMSLPSMPQHLRDDVAFTDHATATTRWLRTQSGGSTIALTDDGAPVDYQMPGFRPNTNVVAGVPSPDGYDGGVQITERWAESLRRFTPTPPIELPLRNSLQIPIDPEAMARLGVRFALVDLDRPGDVFVPAWGEPVVTDDLFAVYENPRWIGDAVAWPEAQTVTGSPADVLREDPVGALGVALVEDPRATLDCDGDDCAPIGLDVDIVTPEHLVVDAALDRPAVISVARQALPGWSVRVDGEPAPEVVVDGLLLGVQVPAGDHTVEWRYRSPWLGWTMVVALLAVAAVIGLVIFDTFGRRADSSSDGDDQPITPREV